MRLFLLLGVVLWATPSLAHRNYVPPDLAWTCKLGDKALLCAMSAPRETMSRMLMQRIDFTEPPRPKIQTALRNQVERLFKLKNPVTLDGTRVRPTIRSMTLLMDHTHAVLEDPALKAPGVELHSSKYDVIRAAFSYPLGGTRPKRIGLTWDVYSAFNRLKANVGQGRPDLSIPGNLLVNGEWTEIRFTADSPSFEWSAADAPAPIPGPETLKSADRSTPAWLWALTLGLLALGVYLWPRKVIAMGAMIWAGMIVIAILWKPAATLSPEETAQVFKVLHRNIYRAFEQGGDESAIYDTIAQSVDGKLLDATYQDVYQSLRLRDDENAVCQVESVRYNDITLEDKWHVRARWTVTGTVSHNGHRHRRRNVYEAIYQIAAVDEQWRLVAVELIDHQRQATATQDLVTP